MQNQHDRRAWPVWATETIEIVESDPGWLKKGSDEREKLLHKLSVYGVTDIEHYGSTAVSGLPAKPIIDLMGKIDSFRRIEQVAHILKEDDWHYVSPDLDGRSWQRFFVKVKDNKRKAHLHIMLTNENRWNDQLLFRNRLRADYSLAQEYAELKKSLLVKFDGDREAYTKAKTDFIMNVINT